MSTIFIITSNYNSYSYIPLAKLSLYSIFKVIEYIRKEGNYKVNVILVDSVSTDGSFEELTKLGKKLSEENDIDFEAIKLEKDLGNSFAFAYGFIYSCKRGAKFIIYMDNDFIIVNPYALKEMIKLAEDLNKLNKKFYAIAPMFIQDDRDKGLRIAKKFSFEEALKIINQDINSRCKILETNLECLDILGRVSHPFDGIVCQDKDFMNLLSSKILSKRFLISPLVASTFSMHPSYVAPIFPYLYIWGDDQITAIQHSLRGYFSYVIPEIAGVHYGELVSKYPSPKRSPKKAYYSHRNYVLSNFSYGSSRYLFYVTRTVYELFIWIPLSILKIKKILKSKYYVLGGYSPSDVTKYAVLGFIHGLTLSERISKMIEKWFNKYIHQQPKKEFLMLFKCRNNNSIIKLLISVFLGSTALSRRRDTKLVQRI
jgi:GT2 family glycosyltransferase